MKFNEKLIELRKKEGLSQKELGYKLDVTRQTVSKWELGQTTPEMDKLVEMSKIFNISIDDLINEEEIKSFNSEQIIEDQPIGENNNKGKKNVSIIVGILIIVIVLIAIKIFTAFSVLNSVNDLTSDSDNMLGKFFSMFENILDKAIDTQKNIMGEIEDEDNKINIAKFNGGLELYNGSNSSLQLKSLLDKVITINKTEEKKVTVKYLEIETQDIEEIKKLKISFNDSSNFEVSFEYDAEGYIYEITIEKVITQFEIKSFNNLFEIYSGTQMGGTVIAFLDQVITSNKTQERKITIVYLENENENENELKSIKRQIKTFDNYDVTLEYDANGFINKAIIESF